MLIAVLVVIWVAALAPMAFRRYRDRRASTSVDRFNYRTWLFRRTYPAIASSGAFDSASRQIATEAQIRAERVRIRRRRERRRRVLLSMVGGILATLVFGAIPALRVLWDMSLVLVLATAGFLALAATAARDEALTLERMRKVVPLATQATGDSESAPRLAVAGPQSVSIVPLVPRPAFRLVEAPSS